MRINSNAGILNTLQNAYNAKRELSLSMEKLSSGQKINKASDNPSGLVISEKLRAQIAGVEREINNIDNTYNKLSVADSSLGSMQNNLQEMRSMAVAAANEGGNSSEAQQAYQNSMDNAVQSYNMILESASYGTQKLLDGSEGSAANMTAADNYDVSSAEKAQETINLIDEKLNELNDARGDIGATQANELDARRNSLETELVNLTASESSVRDVDMAKEYANLVNQQIKLDASMAMLAHENQTAKRVIDLLN